MPYLLDRNMETHLPVIPPDIEEVSFRWQRGKRKYNYNFYRLESHDQDLLSNPSLNIPIRGRIPRKPGDFSVRLPCTGNLSGIAAFSIGLEILSRRKKLAGTPLQLRLRKECVRGGVSRGCDCHSHGECDKSGACVCHRGWSGSGCERPVCEPGCMNGGACTAPGVCQCPAGHQGRACEVGICSAPCLNRGKCIQKDSCQCRPGFYGGTCEFSKCVVPCLNGGECRGVNRCRCAPGYSGDHCQMSAHHGAPRDIGGGGDDGQGDTLYNNPCSRDQCRAVKRCRKQNCDQISKVNRAQMRQCRETHCGSLMQCDKSFCNKYGRRGHRLPRLRDNPS